MKAIYIQTIKNFISAIFLCVLFLNYLNAQEPEDKVQSLKDSLPLLADQAEHEIIRIHFNSLSQVINSKTILSQNDSIVISELYEIIYDYSNPYKLTDLSTYTGRHRSLTVSWISATDGEISFALVRLPENWELENEYPMYIYLHGLWDIAGEKIHYALLPDLSEAAQQAPIAFQDGYEIEPWGRGNLWYRGIAETDIWECITRMDELFNINNKRRYITGYSMGGYGAWYIGSKYSDYWAAVGIQSGVLVYENGLSGTYIEGLSDTPVFFISGEEDDLTQWSEAAYHLLRAAGNSNVELEVVEGGHDWKQTHKNSLYLRIRNYELTSQETDKDNLFIFPNPTTDVVYIGGYGEIVDGKYSVYNMSGALIKQDHCRGRIIHTSDLPIGMYIIKIEYEGKTLYAKLFK